MPLLHSRFEGPSCAGRELVVVLLRDRADESHRNARATMSALLSQPVVIDNGTGVVKAGMDAETAAVVDLDVRSGDVRVAFEDVRDAPPAPDARVPLARPAASATRAARRNIRAPPRARHTEDARIVLGLDDGPGTGAVS